MPGHPCPAGSLFKTNRRARLAAGPSNSPDPQMRTNNKFEAEGFEPAPPPPLQTALASLQQSSMPRVLSASAATGVRAHAGAVAAPRVVAAPAPVARRAAAAPRSVQAAASQASSRGPSPVQATAVAAPAAAAYDAKNLTDR